MAKVTIPIPKGPLKNIVELPEDENVMGAGGSGVGDKGIYGQEIKRALRRKTQGKRKKDGSLGSKTSRPNSRLC